MLRLVLAWVHLIALGIGMATVWARASALGNQPDERALSRGFAADTWWGIAAALWISTGLWRLLAATEQATGYYMRNDAFLMKMGLLVVVLLLEIWPMFTLIRWRIARARGTLDLAAHAGIARRIAVISYVQAGLIASMVALAAAMARGYGVRG